MQTQGKSLKALCSVLDSLDPAGIPDLMIRDIATDSRKAGKGSLFVAVRGYETDGHQYISAAIANGAAAIVAESCADTGSIPCLRVPDSRKAAALLAHAFFGESSRKLKLIGITGTNGKTTVSFLLESILKTAGIETGLIGTLFYRYKTNQQAASRTTPDSVDLNRLLSRMADEGVEAVVMEVSSHSLSLHRVFGMEYQAAIFTNLSRDHLDFHENMDAYRDAKALLFGQVRSGGKCILNADDPECGAMARASSGRIVTYGLQKSADYKIEPVQDETGVHYWLKTGSLKLEIRSPLLGPFNCYNTAAAAAAGIELEIDPDTVALGISNLESVPGRMQGFTTSRGVKVVVDFAHTPRALENVLAAVRAMTGGRVLVVFGCGGERDRGKRPQMGEVAETLADTIYITSDNPRREDADGIIQDIVGGIRSREGVRVIPDRRRAIGLALREAASGDLVLIAGKGHETVQEVGAERLPFNDLAVAQAESSLGEE